MNPSTPPTHRPRPAVQVHRLPVRHTAEVAGAVTAALAVPAALTSGIVQDCLVAAAFVAAGVGAFALAGEVRTHRREWCLAEPITDGDNQAMSPIADSADIAAGHTPSHMARTPVGAGSGRR